MFDDSLYDFVVIYLSSFLLVFFEGLLWVTFRPFVLVGVWI